MNPHRVHLRIVQTPHLSEARRRISAWPSIAVLLGLGAILLALASLNGQDLEWVRAGMKYDLAVLAFGVISALAGLIGLVRSS